MYGRYGFEVKVHSVQQLVYLCDWVNTLIIIIIIVNDIIIIKYVRIIKNIFKNERVCRNIIEYISKPKRHRLWQQNEVPLST